MNNHRPECGDKVKTSAFDNLLQLDTVFFRRVSRPLAVHLAQMGVPRWDIDDLIAEAWLRAVKHSHRFVGDEPERRLHCWLRKVVHRLALDRIRRLARHLCEALDAGNEEPIDEGEAKRTEKAEWSEHLSALQEQVGRGNETNLHLLIAHFFQGCPIQVLAQQFGMTEDAVDSRIRRMVEKLRELA